MPGITQKMLTQQLRELEQDGIVIRTVHHEVPPKVVYTIDPGETKSLWALTKAMCDWANYWASRSGASITHPVVGPGRGSTTAVRVDAAAEQVLE